MQNTEQYVFPDGKSEEDQFNFVTSIMDDIENNVHGELVFKIDINYNKEWMVDIFEHAEEDDDDSFDSLEMVDWFKSTSLKDVFDYLMEKYV